jgi:hypothetical protein
LAVGRPVGGVCAAGSDRRHPVPSDL